MKTVVLTGMDEADLNKKQWDWLTGGSNKSIIKQWPDERLPLTAKSRVPGTKLDRFPDQFSRCVDYEG